MSGVNNSQPIQRIRHLATTVHTTIDRASNDRGASMVEYGLLLVFVFIAAMLSLALFGESIVALFDTSATAIENSPGMNNGG